MERAPGPGGRCPAGRLERRDQESRLPAERRRAGRHHSGTVLRLSEQTLVCRMGRAVVAVVVVPRREPTVRSLLSSGGCRRGSTALAHGNPRARRDGGEVPRHALRAHAMRVHQPEQKRGHPQQTQRAPRGTGPRHNGGRPSRNHAVTLTLLRECPRNTPETSRQPARAANGIGHIRLMQATRSTLAPPRGGDARAGRIAEQAGAQQAFRPAVPRTGSPSSSVHGNSDSTRAGPSQGCAMDSQQPPSPPETR